MSLSFLDEEIFFSKGSAGEFAVGVALGALRGGLICRAGDGLSAILTFFCPSIHLSNVLKLPSCMVIHCNVT